MENNKLISQILNNNKSILIGGNSTGKTYALEEIKKDDKIKNNFLSLNYNFDIDKDIKDSKDRLIQNIKKFLNKITNNEQVIKDQSINKILKPEALKEWQNKNTQSFETAHKFKENLSNKLRDELEKDTYCAKIKINNLEVKKNYNQRIKISYEYNLNFDQLFGSIKPENHGSGVLMYTLIKIISVVLSNLKEKIKEDQDYFFILDEPERFLHPELIQQSAMLLNEISQTIHVICVSHSPLFVSHFIENLSEVIIFDKFDKNKNIAEYFQIIPNLEELKNLYIKNENILLINNNEYSTENIHNYWLQINESGWLNAVHFNIKKDIIESLFYKNIILCEGINDNIYIKRIISESKKNISSKIFILTTWGKFSMPYYLYLLKLFKKNIFTVFDSDSDKIKLKKIHKRVNKFIEAELSSDNCFKIEKDLDKNLGIEESDKKKKENWINNKIFETNKIFGQEILNKIEKWIKIN